MKHIHFLCCRLRAHEVVSTCECLSIQYLFSNVRVYVQLDFRTPSGFDRTRNVEIGNKNIKLHYLEEAYTTEHWLVRIYKVKHPSNRFKELDHAVPKHIKKSSSKKVLAFITSLLFNTDCCCYLSFTSSSFTSSSLFYDWLLSLLLINYYAEFAE